MRKVEVSMKMSPKQAGRLYFKAISLEEKLKWAYCKEKGADSIVGLDCCDDYKDWLASLGA